MTQIRTPDGQLDLGAGAATAPVGSDLPHESALAHVTGAARYTDDLAELAPGALVAFPVQSTQAHARITLDLTSALAVPGVVRILTADDLPAGGINDAGTKHDEPLFPTEAMFVGHALAWVLAETTEAARLGAEAVQVSFEPLPAVLTIEEAIAAQSYQGAQRCVRQGDVAAGLAQAAHTFSGSTSIPGQEHFYFETHASLAFVDESGRLIVHCSTQHPTETQQIVAHALGLPAHEIAVQSLRMGGAFGGKEMQPHGFAAIAALGALLTGRPVRLRLRRPQDITMTGKRHPFHAEWEVGFSAEGRLLALRTTLTANGGWCLDLSEPVLARALCHIENAYRIEHVEATGRVARTNVTSQTAFRGFGGPQGMAVIEDILGRCAPLLGIAADELRRRNLYQPGDLTPYGQSVRHAERLDQLWAQVEERAQVGERAQQIAAFNRSQEDRKRGMAITPVKFGISFNFTPLNQAGALVHIYSDGSVLVSHGGTEMGQGLHTKMRQVAAGALGVPLGAIRIAPTRTDGVPNTSATAASAGADLNGAAILAACRTLRARLVEVAASDWGVAPEQITIDEGVASVREEAGSMGGAGGSGSSGGASMTFAELASAAHMARVSLSATGFYATEGLHWDTETMTGSPFKYFAYGVACSEVEVDGYTGAFRVLRTDIVQDVGDSLNPLIDIGQVEGGFVQGVGWLTVEELRWEGAQGRSPGRLLTSSASTYKLPSLGEMPEEFRVHLLESATESGAIYGSKAVGEPPLMLAFSVREALRQACAAFGPVGHSVDLACPSTPEAVFWAVEAARAAHGVGACDHAVDGHSAGDGVDSIESSPSGPGARGGQGAGDGS